jgi:hypothetical protein
MRPLMGVGWTFAGKETTVFVTFPVSFGTWFVLVAVALVVGVMG